MQMTSVEGGDEIVISVIDGEGIFLSARTLECVLAQHYTRVRKLNWHAKPLTLCKEEQGNTQSQNVDSALL
jgi:hypothetical protein